jgi:hypothetical protein
MVSGSHSRRLRTRAGIVSASRDSCVSDLHTSFTRTGQDEEHHRHDMKENHMNDYYRTRRRSGMMKWVGLGLGLALFGRGRFVRRLLMARMVARGFTGYGGGSWGRFGGYGHGGAGGPGQTFTLPPFIEATLKAWHDRAHGTAPQAPTGPSGTVQV